MADSRAVPGFGQVDLDIEDEPAAPVRSPSPSSSPAFGQVDFDLGEPDEPVPPPSTSRVFNVEKNRPTRRNMPSVHDESTRIVKGDALALASRHPSPLEDDGNTRAWADVDEALLSVGDLDADPFDARGGAPSSRSGNQPSSSGSSSGSGVATRDDRVAAMRELYARGDAAGALALASTLEQSVAPSYAADHPDSSIVVEFGEESVDVDDPFGGLIPLDEDAGDVAAGISAARTFAPPANGTSRPPLARLAPPSLPAPASSTPHLTLTERHSIPRVLKSMAEVSKLKIDHRAGFLLAHVDGMQTLEEILDICAMPAAEALGLISNLREMGVIEFE